MYGYMGRDIYIYIYICVCVYIDIVAQVVKLPLAMQETGLDPWIGKIPLEKGMEAHSSFLAWSIPLDRGAWQATVHGVAKSQTLLDD